jgi:hypothetical protein
MKMMLLAGLMALPLATQTCSDAEVASRNLSNAADNFEINRRIVFFNGITDTYLLEIQGRCSVDEGASMKALSVTCKEGPSAFKKHYLGLSDNVSYFVEQMEMADVSAYHYRVIFKATTRFSANNGMVMISRGLKSPATEAKVKRVSSGIAVIRCIRP